MNQKSLIKIVFHSAIVATVLTRASLSYGLSFVDERSELGANDQLDWSSLPFPPFVPPVGPPVGPPSFLPSSFPISSDRGLGITISFPEPEPGITQPLYFQTRDDNIPTNYAPNDFILFSGLMFPAMTFPAPGNPGPLTITFDSPILGFGSQLTVDDIFSFVGKIEAFDINNVSLGEFSLPGTSSTELDNSAQFYGVINDVPNISKITFSTDIDNSGIGVNFLSIVTVPEPSLWMGLLFMAGCGLISKKNKKSF
ncbi:PEP-CTERM sorting domain-containing protein [Crocosphaera sp. Alani8]|uniref:PEP-CTERM sorting domain-containing protein n=1 Tax=Crocosphaera sp. Alani8 TaxID=3038952 RepID=UPI00313C7770